MDAFLILKTVHILSATILFGTGLGTAFFFWRAQATDNVQAKLFAARTTVLADYLFTAPAVVIQPLSGFLLIHSGGYGWLDLWLVLTYGLYIIAGVCWLPVVWIQIQLKTMLVHSAQTGEPLPERYHKLFKLWFALGWPAFIGLVIVFFLMVLRPV